MPAQNLRAATTGADYRADIDGLRTLAIVLVVVYHVWLGRVSGGVDVFLMISAFLLTGSLARRVVSGRPIALPQFWANRFRSLVPLAAVTLLGVLGLAYAFYPPIQWGRIWNETLASLFYVENWQLAFSEVDYYARDSAETSPLQHFWSLSVQGQVFVLWPILIALVAVLLRSRRHLIRPALIGVFATIFVASLAFSVIETRTAQDFAYFDTRTRLWEFAAGSLLALLLPMIRLAPLVRVVLGWVGLLGILLCGVVLDVRGGFPGYLALWPVLCTAAIIVAGAGPSRGGPTRLLGSRPMTYLARDAYALYLVHWPILVTWMVLAEADRLDLLSGAIVIALSVLVARLLTAAVDRPLGRLVPRERPYAALRGLAVVSVSLLVVVGATVGWRTAEQVRAAEIVAESADADYPGAGQIESAFDITADDVPVMPLPAGLDDEWAAVGPACDGRLAPESGVLEGTCNQSVDAEMSGQRILVIGDSHAQQLATPLIALSEEQDFSVITLLQGGCTAGLFEASRSPVLESCEEWVRAAFDYAKEIGPDAVYIVVTRADATQPERLLDGIQDAVNEMSHAGIPVIAVRDNPRFEENMYWCALDNGGNCTVDRSLVLADSNPALELGEGIDVVDFTPWLCPYDACSAVIGNIAVYIDDNHVSRTYGRTLAPYLQEMLSGMAFIDAPSG